MLTSIPMHSRFRLFLVAFVVLSLLFSVALWVTKVVSIRTYFVVSFLCMLIISELFAPTSPDSAWWDRLKWAKVGGWIVLGYILFERVITVVQ